MLDSFNGKYNYDQTIPDTGGSPYDELKIISETDFTAMRTLVPGWYRIECRGGYGGRGGNSATMSSGGGDWTGLGGIGNRGKICILKLRVYSNIAIEGILGGNGADGTNGNMDLTYMGQAVVRAYFATGGGGGSSGGDTILQIADNGPIILDAMGGSGGGGAAARAFMDSSNSAPSFYMTGAGGGGSGWDEGLIRSQPGDSWDGVLPGDGGWFQFINPPKMRGGQPGDFYIGGSRGEVLEMGGMQLWNNGQYGQNRYVSTVDGILRNDLYRRNGGNSADLAANINNNNRAVAGGKGGAESIYTNIGVDSYLRIFQTRAA